MAVLRGRSDGNALQLFEPGGAEPVHTFDFPRQPRADGLCLADYVLPAADGVRDSVALFVVGAGEGVRERAERRKANGEYLRSHALQALALETAEAAAEWLHRRLRADWGFPDPPSSRPCDRFEARYRGKRYCFGYPACPDLDDQAALFELLQPGGHRRRAHRGHDDGPRGVGLRDRLPPPRLHVLLGVRDRAVAARRRAALAPRGTRYGVALLQPEVSPLSNPSAKTRQTSIWASPSRRKRRTRPPWATAAGR